MSPAAKYTLGRLGLFLIVFVALLPVTQLHILVRAMVALLVSAVAAFFLLRAWRDQAAEQIAGAAARRRAERERLRTALAGQEDGAPAAEGAAADGAAGAGGAAGDVEADAGRRAGEGVADEGPDGSRTA